MTLKILHVVRQFAPSVGGLEDVVLNLARHQRSAHGLDATVATLDRVFTRPHEPLPEHDVVAGVPVRRLRWWGSTRYPIAPGVLALARQADLVHVHAIDFFVDFLALTRPIHRRPMVVVTQGGFFHTPRQARLKRLWFNTITRTTLRAFDAVVGGSENDAAMFEPLNHRRLLTIENGADLGKLRLPPGTNPGNDIARLPRRILYLGRFAPHKRIGALFPLLAALRRTAADWTLVVAGIEAGETVASLQRQATDAGVGDAVRFVVGAEDAVLAREAAAATWFACLSAFEGFGVAAVEAAAVGLLPILSRIPTFERLAASLPHAVLADVDAPDAAARAVQATEAQCQDRWPETRTAIMDAARRHDWSHATARYVALYQDVLGRAA